MEQLCLPEKRLRRTGICFEAKEGLTLEFFSISGLFKKLYSSLVNYIVQRLAVATEKFDIASVENYYNNMFHLSLTHSKLTFQIVQPMLPLKSF